MDICQPSTFSPSLPGGHILAIAASIVSNYSVAVPARVAQPPIDVEDVSFCNVTVTYTHPGQDDVVQVETWLPLEWNQRLMGIGGGGFVAGRSESQLPFMAAAAAEGYVSVTSDAGLGKTDFPDPWALLSPGNVNLYLLRNFAAISQYDASILAKDLTKSFYGRSPSYSYWNGCSQGGRQGLALAQRYPDAYDGIMAAAPGIFIPQFFPAMYWPQQYMNDIDTYPYSCEIDAITQAAVDECDGLDGVEDGIISDPDACFETFDPFQQVGKDIGCLQTNGTLKITEGAAKVVNATWSGVPTTTKKPFWYGFRPGADLTATSPDSSGFSTATTNCTSGKCTGAPNFLASSWMRLFAAKDPEFDIASLTFAEFLSLSKAAREDYYSFWSTSDPDLSEFRDVGGKMITYHGLADQLIPDQGTIQYYESVTDILPDVSDFYRYFPVPGVGHCFGGPGGQPNELFEQLRYWVENGTVPETSSVVFNNTQGVLQHRILCPYPKEAVYDEECGDAAEEKCWCCK